MSTRQLRSIAFLVAIGVGSVVLGQLASLVFGTNHETVPLAVQVQAMVNGCPAALLALGIVLIYRSNRIINFAQTAFGGVGAITALALLRHFHWPWALAMLAGFLLACALGGITEALLIRRFVRATRLVLTVVTIGAAQLLLGVTPLLLRSAGVGDEELSQLLNRIETPFSGTTVEWFPVVFTGDHFVLALTTVALMAGIAAFLRFSRAGIAVRAASENDDRAALLGINTRTLSTIVWVVAAALSGIASILQLPISGVANVSAIGLGSGLLLRSLAAAVFGRFENLPAVVVAALALSVFEQSVFFAVGRRDVVTLTLFAVLLGGLLLQRKQLSRAQVDDSGTWASTEEIRPVPPELAGLPEVKRAGRWVVVGGAILALGYPWVGSVDQVNLGGIFAIYGIIAVSLVILIGWGGQISLGQWGLAAVGALVGGSMTGRFHLPFFLGILVASLVGAGISVLLGLPALRIKGLFLAVTTLAFSLVASDVVLNERWFGWMMPVSINRPQLLFIDTEDERAFYYLCLAGLAFAVFCAQGLRKSRTGRVLIAMRDNERTAQAIGINLVRTRLATFALSGFLASMAGALYAHHQHALNPQSFGADQSIQMFLMAVIGGLGSVVGVLAGPIYIGLFATFLEDYAFFGSAVGVLFVLLVVPGGLGGLGYALRDTFLRRVAIRRRLYVPSLLADHLVGGELSRIPLLPERDPDGEPIEAPVHYRRPSRIAVAGSSQASHLWDA